MAINHYTGVGNLTRDAVLRRTNSGSSVLDFGVAINDGRTNKQTGEWEETPVFIDCAMFSSRAEKIAQYLVKGTRVTVDGRLRWSSWTKDGQKRSKLDLVVNEVVFMSRNQGGGDDYHSNVRQQQAQYVEATYFDDDCPF